MKYLLLLLEPIGKLFTKFHTPWAVKKFTGDDYITLQSKLVFGSVIMTTSYGYILNLFNPTKLKHSAIHIGGGRVAEMTTDGLRYTNLMDFLFSKDVVVACNPRFALDQGLVFHHLTIHEKDEYDWQFDSGNKDSYCHELVAKALEAGTGGYIGIKIQEEGGVKVYSPQSFIEDKERFEIVFVSKEAERKKILE